MPEPFANPIGGFTQGFQSGTSMGLLLRERKQKQDQRLAEIETEKQKMSIKQMENAMSLMSDKDMPSAIKLKAYSSFAPLWNQFNPDSEMGELTEWPEEGSKFAQRALKIQQNPQYDQNTKLQALRELHVEATALGETIDVTGIIEPLEKEVEAGAVTQALDIRALQQDPRFKEGLTPEQQAQVGAPSAERGLLARGGATGQALLKEGAKPEAEATVASITAGAITKANEQGVGSLSPIELGLVNKKISTGEVSTEIRPDGTVVITKGTKGGLAKPTVTAIEKDIIAGQKTIGSLNEAEKIFDPSFLTVEGKGRAFISSQAEKLGFSTDKEYLEARTKWRNQAKSAFLVYRKWVTGVAGGEKEFKEIAKAFPDPERNSPTEYMANLEQTRSWARATDLWLRETKALGLSLEETREIVEQQAAPTVKEVGELTDEELDAELSERRGR